MLLIDDRELSQHKDIPDLIGIPVTIDRLEAADYAFLSHSSEPIGIERCEVSNLIQKLHSGELEDQMIKCNRAYGSIILLIEGVYDQVQNFLAVHGESERGYFRKHIYPHTRYDYTVASLVRLSQMGIELVHSPNFACSMVVVRTIYQQRTKAEGDHSLFKKIRRVKLPVKLSTNPAVPKLLALANHMPEKTAIRLINKYGTIWNVLNAGDDELLEVEGMGKGLLDKLKKGVGKDELET